MHTVADLYLSQRGSAPATDWEIMSGYNAEITAQENEPSDALVAQRLWERLQKSEKLNKQLAYYVIGNAETEAEMGSVCESTYDSLLDIYFIFEGDAEMQSDVLVARKAMRQNEWGIEFRAEEFDLELDEDWQE